MHVGLASLWTALAELPSRKLGASWVLRGVMGRRGGEEDPGRAAARAHDVALGAARQGKKSNPPPLGRREHVAPCVAKGGAAIFVQRRVAVDPRGGVSFFVTAALRP